MTILSFSMLSRFMPMQQIKASGLAAQRRFGPTMDERAHRAWARSVKYYENLKVVYQVQTMLRDWQQQADEQNGEPAGRAHSRTIASCP